MTHTPANPVVWTEIPVRDIDRGIAFYKSVFEFSLTRDDTGPNPMAMFKDDMNGVSGHLYPGEPAASGNGPTIHMVVPDSLEAAADRCWKAGGTINGDPIPLPSGRFQYALDPDGNSIGLYEANAA
ncbi:MAG: VOC family protein [Boseongicola sp.]|nr:MAG: VOC family protein [Boseongicola sp.]